VAALRTLPGIDSGSALVQAVSHDYNGYGADPDSQDYEPERRVQCHFHRVKDAEHHGAEGQPPTTMHSCPTSFLPSKVVLVAGVILAVSALVETALPLVSHPAHRRLSQRLVIGVPLLVTDAIAAYFLIRGWFLSGIGVGIAAGFSGLFAAGKLEKALIAEEKMTDAERAAAIKRAGRLPRLVRSFVVAVLAALVAMGALPL
jgi:hypothetical protein